MHTMFEQLKDQRTQLQKQLFACEKALTPITFVVKQPRGRKKHEPGPLDNLPPKVQQKIIEKLRAAGFEF